MSKFLTFALASCFLLFVCAPTPAQTTNATLSGVVEDEKGASIPGAKVSIMNPATGLIRTVVSDESGAYIVPLLPPATYTVMAEQTGFKRVQFPDIVLNVNDQRSLRIQLEVGDVSGVVEVRADDAPMVDTSPAVSTTVDRTFVGNLPLNGRSFQSLILLTPGVVATPSNQFNPGGFSVNGQRQNANYFTVDGVSANTGVSTAGGGAGIEFSLEANGGLPGTTALGTTASLVSVDALEEFKIQTSTYSAELGRQPGAQVQLITRSGTNDFHGSAFEYLRNEVFDARNWFDRNPAKPRLRQNQFGGTLSGPVILPRFGETSKPYWSGRDKTFFFFSYEGLRLVLPTVLSNFIPNVPSLRLRQVAAPALQPFLNSFPLPTGPETTTTTPCDPATDPACSPITRTKYSGAAPFAASFSSPSNVDAYSVRIDQIVGTKLTLFGRFAYTPSNNLDRFMHQLAGSVKKNVSLTLGATLYFSPHLNNEFRINYSSNKGQTHFSMDNFGGGVPLTLSQLTSDYSGPGVKQGAVTVGAAAGNFRPQRLGDAAVNYSRQLNIVDNVSWTKGSHQMRFGIDWRRLDSPYQPIDFGQNVRFIGENSLISSIATSASFFAFGGARPIYNNYSFYAQDTWRLSRRLTADIGLRWDMNPAPSDANGLRPVVLTGIDGIDVSNVALAAPDAPFYKTFKAAFAPRMGLAYLLNRTNGRETVLRGGFGVYYDLGSGMASSLFGGYPFSQNVSLGAADRRFPLSPELVHPPAFLPVPTQVPPGVDFYALDPNLQLPYTLQWNATIEQSLGRQQKVVVSYVGSAARRLTATHILNQFFPPNPLTVSPPNPSVGNITYITNGSSADYKSLQAQYQIRLSRGFQALLNYTFAHAVDDVSDETSNGNSRGNASFDVRHNFSAGFSFNLPTLKGGGGLAKRFAKGLTDGWSFEGIVFARTGTPLDVSAAGLFVVLPDGTSFHPRPDIVSGVPFWISDPSVPGGQRLNPAAFALPPTTPGVPFYYPLRQGTLPRNAVYTPGMYQLNLAVRRRFSLGERLKLQLKAEAFNALNHPIFGGQGSYNTNRSSSDFGVAGGTLSNSLGGLNSLYQLGGARSMQFSLRLDF